ncbi:MAG: hypothetical protein U0Q03_07315 [Acidimicrobiales bacterium]
MSNAFPLRSSRSGRRSLALAATLVLSLAACGGGDSSGDEGTNPDDPRNSPLAQLLGYDSSPAEQRAKDLELQQVMVECMKDEGWEYQAVDWSAQGGDFMAEYEEQMADPEGYGEKYGYGVVRNYEMQGDLGSTTFEDPNQDYVNSLDPDEQTAYYEALYGATSSAEPITDDTEFVMPSLDEQGCSGKAQLEVYGDSPMNDPDMQERLNELFEDEQNAPELQDAYDEWASCMADKDPSYEWTTPEEVVNSFWDRMNELQGFQTEEGDGTATGAVVVGGSTDGSERPEIDEADLDDLRADEIATWTDDWACQQEADIAQVRREVEQRLVDDLVAEFPELGKD